MVTPLYGSPDATRGRAVIRNAVLPAGGTGDVVIDGARMGGAPGAAEDDVVDLDGRLLVPAFAEPHVHLDRAFSMGLTGWNRTGTLQEAVERFLYACGRMTVEALASGARRALVALREAGVCHVRTHTAAGGDLGFRAWEAVELAAAGVPQVRVEQVVMALDGPEGDGDGVHVAREAAARGAVAVGGSPWRADDPVGATRAAAELAASLGVGLDLHVDETDDGGVSTLAALAEAAEATGLGGRAIAAHCCSLAARCDDRGRREAWALGRAGVAVVVCPVSNLSLQGRTSGARGMAPLRLLRDAGVPVGIGLDNIRDVVVGVGTSDPLRAAWLAALAGHMTGEDDLDWLASSVFTTNRVIAGLPAWPRVGDDADLLVVDARTPGEAVALVPERRPLGAVVAARGWQLPGQ